MKYESITIYKVDSEKLYLPSDEKIPRKINSGEVVIEYSRYSDNKRVFYFVKESEAIRYCKAQMMKELFTKIKNAKSSIQSVKDFRNEHFELLNHDWTELQIQKLEAELK
ncbi:MAG TPA: hypothetical protein VGF79_00945 [Bacteroidia bacterium]